MRWTKALLFCCCTLILTAPVAWAQGNGLVEIKVPKEMPIAEFLDLISRSTGKPLLYAPNGQRIKNQTMGAGFTHKIPKDRSFDTFRAILAFFELSLVPIGPKGFEI